MFLHAHAASYRQSDLLWWYRYSHYLHNHAHITTAYFKLHVHTHVSTQRRPPIKSVFLLAPTIALFTGCGCIVETCWAAVQLWSSGISLNSFLLSLLLTTLSFLTFPQSNSSPFCVIYAKSNLQVGDPSESMEKNDLELYFQKKKKNIHVYTAVKSGDKVVWFSFDTEETAFMRTWQLTPLKLWGCYPSKRPGPESN